MAGFSMPLSSSPLAPSTPGSNKQRGKRFNDSEAYSSNPSTTPAGPPPSSIGSFTPAGPPPSSILGSSQLSSAFPSKNLFSNKSPLRPSQKSGGHGGLLDSSPAGYGSGKSLFAPNESPKFNESSRFGLESNFNIPNGSTTDDRNWDHFLNGDVSPSLTGGTPGRFLGENPPKELCGSRGGNSPRKIGSLRSSILSPQRKAKPASKGSPAAARTTQGLSRTMRNVRKNGESSIPGIAANLAQQMGTAELNESNEFISGTDRIISALNSETSTLRKQDDALPKALSTTCERLGNVWAHCRQEYERRKTTKDDVFLGIGPEENAPLVQSAIYLGSLALPLYHPPTAKGKQALALSRLDRSTSSHTTEHLSAPYNPTAYPKLLLDWLDTNHNPYNYTLDQVFAQKPSPASHSDFWDMLLMLVLRGAFYEAVSLLKRSDFRSAATAKEDGARTSGYKDMQFAGVMMVTGTLVECLEASPALKDDNWHVTGSDWVLYRKLVTRSLDDMVIFADGRDKSPDQEKPSFEASNFGLGSAPKNMTKQARKAESRVPWTIFQNIKTIYGILLGGASEIISSSQDWVEATLALTAWWPGNDDDELGASSLGLSTNSLSGSTSRNPRLVDHNERLAYLRRLSACFERVLAVSDEGLLLPNPVSPLEVALASMFESNVQGLVGILKGFSLPVADAVVEVASVGGWLDPHGHSEMLDGFDESDLMVLGSYAPSKPLPIREQVMTSYADALFEKDKLETGVKGDLYGWELAIAVAARIAKGNDKTSKQRINDYLQRLPQDSDEQIDKISAICRRYQMTQEGKDVVGRYADSILDTSDDYGSALVYYARAHSEKKIKNVLDLLVSYSLVRSRSYPSLSNLDDNLAALVSSPQQTLEHLALLDPEAAEMLHRNLSGYATLRKFYDLRDHGKDGSATGKAKSGEPTDQPDATAAKCLLVVIDSAADSITGGLYDAQRDCVVRVDGLLTLLGEASILLNRTPSILTLPQSISLLRAIENLSIVTPSIYNRCNAFLRSTLSTLNQDSNALASPHALLKKQMSSMTSAGSNASGGTNSFSLVGSSMLLDNNPNASAAASGTSSDVIMIDSATSLGGGDGESSATGAQQTSPSSKRRKKDDKDDGASEEERESTPRGWDWRERYASATTTSRKRRTGVQESGDGKDVDVGGRLLKDLRLALAKEIAGHWIREV